MKGATRAAKVVLFDIDGTLLRSDGAGRRAMEAALLAVFGVTGSATYRYDGKTDRLIVRESMRAEGFSDDATPNGNGVAALALGRLGHLLAEPRYLDAAATTIQAAVARFGDWPHAHAAVLLALDEAIEPPTLEIYRGTPDQLWGQSQMTLTPALVFRIPTNLGGLPGQLAHQPALDGALTLYRCTGTHCEAPRQIKTS